MGEHRPAPLTDVMQLDLANLSPSSHYHRITATHNKAFKSVRRRKHPSGREFVLQTPCFKPKGFHWQTDNSLNWFARLPRKDIAPDYRPMKQ
jgi:hypothetical protein